MLIWKIRALCGNSAARVHLRDVRSSLMLQASEEAMRAVYLDTVGLDSFEKAALASELERRAQKLEKFCH
jgi:hypothetical protein